MKPFYQDNNIHFQCEDFRKNDLPDESVQMVCTSPPYWGLRKYSGEQELIWGDNHCEHEWNDYEASLLHENRQGLGSGSIGNTARRQGKHGHKAGQAGFCSLCGAWKGSYGLEPTPALYIQHTIEILREIRRVLREDGVVFWNIGDSYYSSPSNQQGKGNNSSGVGARGCQPVGRRTLPWHNTLKPKDLCLIPFRVAIAAQEDGWWVRSVIIWAKPNPMPESVTDRPTESHEYILMLTRSARYYWDADAVREPISESYANDKRPHGVLRQHFYPNSKYVKAGMMEAGKGLFPTGERATGRNIRSVWEFATQPYPETHFAVFPEKLPEICIKAATPEAGCCSKCGAPWSRVLDKKPSQFNIRVRDAKAGRVTPEEGYKATEEEIERYPGNHPDPGYRNTIGWQPTCSCNADKVPSLVLDPFMGAGTTLWVAKKLGRRAVGYEISHEYCDLALNRNRQQALELSV